MPTPTTIWAMSFGNRAGSTRRSPLAAARSRSARFVEAHSNLGNALKDQGKLHEAVTAYRRAIELNADHADAHSNLGVALKELGRFDEAIAALSRAVEIKPDHAEVHNNLGSTRLGRAITRGQSARAAAPWRCGRAIRPPTRTC